jgi:serine protease Do
MSIDYGQGTMNKGALAAIAVAAIQATAMKATADDPRSPADPADSLGALEAEQAGLFGRVAPSVVLLVRDGVSGSGFVVADGLILTNAHVVGEADEVAVQTRDGRYGRARVVARATGPLDLALVRSPFPDLPPLPSGDPGELRAGTFAATIGHGGGAAWTYSTGLVANPSPLGDGAPVLLAQMALRPGSSGGPLVDRRGRVIGIVTSGTRDASGVTFAIRVDAAAAAFPQLVSWRMPSVELAVAEPARAAGRAEPLARTIPPAAAAPFSAPPPPPPAAEGLARTEPAPARMFTVWEAQRPVRRRGAPAERPRPLVPAHVVGASVLPATAARVAAFPSPGVVLFGLFALLGAGGWVASWLRPTRPAAPPRPVAR